MLGKDMDAKDMHGKEMATPKLSRKELVERLRAEFPEASHAMGDYIIEDVLDGRLPATPTLRR